MFSRKAADSSAAVQVPIPSPADDRPSWVKVGLIAAIGFIVGIGWPRLAGVRLGPSAPEVASAVASAAPAPSASPSDSVAALPPPPVPSAAAIAPAAALPAVTVGKGFVLSCKTDDGATLKATECGALSAFEPVAQPRLKKLEKCTAADGVSGKLAVVVGVDFEGNHISVDNGKATTVASPDPLLGCLRDAFQGAPMTGVDHQYPRYNVLYTVTLTAPPSAATAAQAASGAGGDEAPGQVTGDIAIVRDAPRGKQILTRLPHGAKIMIGPGKDNWYKVRYGSDFSSEGFVYRSAIGK